MVYKNELTNTEEILDSFNNITPTMTFTMEEEVDNRLNFLDITISKTDHKISFSICRKPAATVLIIPNDSCHPPEQKLAAIRYLIDSLSNISYEQNKQKKRT